jgi:hypothetical protein
MEILVRIPELSLIQVILTTRIASGNDPLDDIHDKESAIASLWDDYGVKHVMICKANNYVLFENGIFVLRNFRCISRRFPWFRKDRLGRRPNIGQELQLDSGMPYS